VKRCPILVEREAELETLGRLADALADEAVEPDRLARHWAGAGQTARAAEIAAAEQRYRGAGQAARISSSTSAGRRRASMRTTVRARRAQRW
jgi:hypothetical protein